ncbi:MAG: TrmH family RNA methyltransferase [Patescibacteria group bacterium]
MRSEKPQPKRKSTQRSFHKDAAAFRREGSNQEVIAMLHNIRSLQNVGAMFRTADAAGIQRIILTGYTPTPLNLLGEVRTEFAKTALGAERSVQWEQKKNISSVISQLKSEGHNIYAIEETMGAKNIFTYRTKKPCAFVVGNEVTGLSRAVLVKCDAVLAIPMKGIKESLNVSVAFGIAAYEIVK